MARASRSIVRNAALLLLVLVLQGSTCQMKSDTSNHDPDPNGGMNGTMNFVPELDHLGRPTGALIPLDLSSIGRVPTHGR